MRSIKGLLVGLVLAGILSLPPTAAFARGGGGGHFGGGGGHVGARGGHSGGSGHFAGFTGHGFARHQGAHFGRNENHFRHGGHFFFGSPFWYDYGYNDSYYGYDDDYAGEYAAAQSSPDDLTPTFIAVQKELAQLGYYHSEVDGLMGPQTERAIRWFQSVEKLPVIGQIDDPTLKALQIS
jgi:hypothetical protein